MEGLHSGENIGGVLEIGICHIDDIASSKGSIRFKPNKWWTVVEFIPATATFMDDEADTEHGILYTYSGAFRRQFPSKSDEIIFSKFIGTCNVIRIIDLNGQCRIIGTIEQPVTISRVSNRGAKPSDLSYSEFKYSVTQSVRAL